MSDAAASPSPTSAPAPAAPTTNAPAASPSAVGAAPPAPVPPSGAGESTSPPPPKRYAVKYGDKSEELTEEQLIHRAQKAYGAEQAFREAAEVRKEQEAFKAALKDPMKAREYLAKYGGDPDALMKSWALHWHQQQEMTPEQREIAAAKAEAEQYRFQVEAQKAEQAQRAFQQQTEEAHGRFVETFSAAIAKAVGPDVKPEAVSPRLLQAMANWQQANLASGVGAPPEVVAQEAVESALADGVAALGLYKTQPAELVKRLGPELVGAIINEVVRMEDEKAGIVAPKPSRPVVVNGNGHAANRNPDGTFKPAGRESREQASFNRFINGGTL